MNNYESLMNPMIWAKHMPITGKVYEILQILAEGSDLYGKGMRSKPNLIVKSGLKCSEVDEAIHCISENKIATITYTQNSTIIHFQLCLHIPPSHYTFRTD